MKINSNEIKDKEAWFMRPRFLIPVIFLIGLTLRLYIFPYEVPFKLDSLDIFTYATIVNQTGKIPVDFSLANNGWPLFVSLFFSISNLDAFSQLIHLQRFLGMSFSLLTIIPVYFLAKKFFNEKLAIIAISLFIFDFRLIINSVSGENMGLYIFLVTTGIYLFFGKEKTVYLSFIIFALSSIVRYEGLLIFIPISIIYLIRFRKQKISLLKYVGIISLVILILLPIAYLRIENTGEDGFISSFSGISSYYENELLTGYAAQCTYGVKECDTKVINDESWTSPGKDNVTPFIIAGVTGMSKYFVWSLVPVFLLFFIPALFFIIKNQKFRKINSRVVTLIILSIFLILPAFYSYGRHFEEARYLFIIFPLICLFCLNCFDFKWFEKFRSLIFVVIGVILILSIGVLVYKDLDTENQYNREVFQITSYIAKNVDGINYFHPESEFMKSGDAFEKWPDTLDIDERRKAHVKRATNLLITDNINSLEEFISNSKSKGLTHLYADGQNFRSQMMNDVFFNEDKHPYLIKQFDSKEKGLEYHVKIFKIDFQIFENQD